MRHRERKVVLHALGFWAPYQTYFPARLRVDKMQTAFSPARTWLITGCEATTKGGKLAATRGDKPTPGPITDQTVQGCHKVVKMVMIIIIINSAPHPSPILNPFLLPNFLFLLLSLSVFYDLRV